MHDSEAKLLETKRNCLITKRFKQQTSH